MWYGLKHPGFDCSACDARKRDKRNCHNHKGFEQEIYEAKEWHTIPSSIRPVAKWGKYKIFSCPLSLITKTSWDIIKAVNNTISAEGDSTRPYRAVCWEDEPEWYKQACDVVRSIRAQDMKDKQDALKQGRKRG